jgi:predicted ATPase
LTAAVCAFVAAAPVTACSCFSCAAVPGAVCEAGLAELESLVDKALVKLDGRFLMLETIREYAREQLDAAGETEEISARYAERYAAVGREIREGIEGTAQVASVERGIARTRI